MRMDLIQPFIGSLDTVLAEMMKAPAKIVDLTMEEDGYRKKGAAALVCFRGQIEGRVILDMEPRAAQHTSPAFYRKAKWTPPSRWCRKPSANWPTWSSATPSPS